MPSPDLTADETNQGRTNVADAEGHTESADAVCFGIGLHLAGLPEAQVVKLE